MIMFKASIWNKHRTDTNTYQVQLLPAGVVIIPDEGADEVFVPFGSGRVHEVHGGLPGEIGLILGQ
jgi:hypothetical protein